MNKLKRTAASADRGCKDETGREGFTCECGKFHVFGVYVMGHWGEELTHTCDCGRRHIVQAGAVVLLDDE